MSGRFGYVLPQRRMSRSKRAGLLFPVGQIHRSLRKTFGTARIGKMAPIYLTSVLEYTMAEIFDMAGHLVKMMSDRRTEQVITPRHIRLVIHNDDELREVFKGVILPSSGGGNLDKDYIRKMKFPAQEELDTEFEEEEEDRDTRRTGVQQGSRASYLDSNGNVRKKKNSKHNCYQVIDLTPNSHDEEEEQSVRPKMKKTPKVPQVIDLTPNSHDEEEEQSVRPKMKKTPKVSKDSFSLMPELDAKTFGKCKEKMRLFQETIIALGTSKEQLNNRKRLVKIGDHIESLVASQSRDEARNWRYNFWLYVSHFNNLEAQALHQMYLRLVRGK